MQYPRVSIIILNWNGLSDTLECLQSLKKIKYPNYEIIIVDNASQGNDVEVLQKKYSDYIRLIRNSKNLGFTGGNNIAINKVLDEGNSKYILFLNNDTVVEQDFLIELVKVAESDSKIGVIGPEIHDYDPPRKIHSRGGVVSLIWGPHFVGGTEHRRRYKDDTKFELQYYSGCAFMARGDVLKKTGGFDSDYFYYGEDIDLGFRIFRAGYKIKCAPESKIYHKVGQSVGGNIRNPMTAFYETRNAVMFVRKHGHFYHLVLFVLILLLKMLYDLFRFFKFEKKLLSHRLKGLGWHLKNKI